MASQLFDYLGDDEPEGRDRRFGRTQDISAYVPPALSQPPGFLQSTGFDARRPEAPLVASGRGARTGLTELAVTVVFGTLLGVLVVVVGVFESLWVLLALIPVVSLSASSVVFCSGAIVRSGRGDDRGAMLARISARRCLGILVALVAGTAAFAVMRYLVLAEQYEVSPKSQVCVELPARR